MTQDLSLYTVSDEYVRYLSEFDKKVTSNKEDNRNFERKYLGTVLSINDIDYFVPLASPKNSDYMADKDGNKTIRKSIVPIIRMAHKERDGIFTLIGTIKFSNMIPVMDSEVKQYDIENEPDLAYRDLVYKQWAFIRSHKSEIYKHAQTIYSQKTKNYKNIGYLDNTVDFLLLEQKAKDFVPKAGE